MLGDTAFQTKVLWFKKYVCSGLCQHDHTAGGLFAKMEFLVPTV
jgi:hypothetical protein